jgi:hypothetical protein
MKRCCEHSVFLFCEPLSHIVSPELPKHQREPKVGPFPEYSNRYRSLAYVIDFGGYSGNTTKKRETFRFGSQKSPKYLSVKSVLSKKLSAAKGSNLGPQYQFSFFGAHTMGIKNYKKQASPTPYFAQICSPRPNKSL